MSSQGPLVLKLIYPSGKKKYYHTVVLTKATADTLQLDFEYNEYLKDEVKSMEGARWNPDSKCWTVKDSQRNWFQIKYLMGQNPYAWYDQTLKEFTPRIPKLYPQQHQMAQEAITYRQVIWAAEMGLGKTLAAIEAIEHLGSKAIWWVGPKSALASFDVEVDIWGMLNYPSRVMTYEELTKVMKNWKEGDPYPNVAIFDEFSRCKNLTAQRSQAAKTLADGMRAAYGENVPMIIGMTGTPAPKSPLDWYSLCEIVKPGFIREGTIHKFRERLGVVVKKENTTTGGIYPSIVTWRDSTFKCKLCGYEQEMHDFEVMGQGLEPHSFEPGTNEIERLYKRLKGLVSVYFKKDWLSYLPDKNYRVLQCKVNLSTQNAARAVKNSARSVIQGLTLLRELSDGFLYAEEIQGTTVCPLCQGSKRTRVPVIQEDESYELEEVTCTHCGGEGEVPRSVRVTDSVNCPKDDLLEDILDDHEDGRLVTYAGFTGSIDRIVNLVERKAWSWIRVDGRGWASSFGVTTPKELVHIFQRQGDMQIDKLAFIGHPGSAGMGLTLTASNEIVYFSNDFNAESRAQSEDRIHRPGMDLNKGCMITDLVNLDTDLLIIKNLKEKKRLQDMSLGAFKEALKELEQ
jgi:SNF2 family DNA or RNA helicase